jgi:phosphate:Na+ symporter
MVWLEAFSGLGLFVFGMLYLETQIKLSAGRAFKRIVRHATATRLKSLLTGLGATALFQSSSVVTLMTLSLVGSELMTRSSAIGVIFGSNVGTTITTWIVALVGFKIDIGALSYLMVGLGGLGTLLAGEEGNWRHYFGMMVGFGLIFLGLEAIKSSFESFSHTFDVASMSFSNPYWYLLIGAAITAIIQSSSASIAIIQSALYAQLVCFETAVAFVIGANIGTTITAILGALGSNADKKRTALAHLVFNLSTGFVVSVLLHPLSQLIEFYFKGLDTVIQIALFHTFFNLAGVLLWYPFLPWLARWIERFFVPNTTHVTHYLHKVSTEVPELSLEALHKELNHLCEKIEAFALLGINIPPSKALEEHRAIDKPLKEYRSNLDLSYDTLCTTIRRIEGEIYRYHTQLAATNTAQSLQRSLEQLIRQTIYLATAAKAIKNMLPDIDRLCQSDSSEELVFYDNLRYQILKSTLAFHDARTGQPHALEEIDHIYRKIADSYSHSLDLIHDIAQNPKIKSEMTAISINAMHLTKSYSKSLRNALTLDCKSDQKGTEGPQNID